MEGAAAKTVGVALDFSDCSKAALKWARDHQVRPGDRLIALCIDEAYGQKRSCADGCLIDGSPKILITPGAGLAEIERYGVKPDPETMKILSKIASQEVEVIAKVYWGNPRQKIVEAVDELNLDCLVVGNHGLGNKARALRGRVCEHVVKKAKCPVIVVKETNGETERQVRHVGVAMDFSAKSKLALQWACDHHLRADDELTVLCITSKYNENNNPWRISHEEFINGAANNYNVKPDEKTKGLLDNIARMGVTVFASIHGGVAYNKIIDAARHLELDCLVVGNRWQSRIRFVPLCCVSRSTVCKVECPVIVVKDELRAA